MTEIGSYDFKNVSCNLRATLNDSWKVIFIISESWCKVKCVMTLIIRPVIIIVTVILLFDLLMALIFPPVSL